MKQELRKQKSGSIVSKLFLLSLMTIGFINCSRSQSNEPCGLILQEFEIVDPQLKLLIEKVRDSLAVDEIIEDCCVPIIELRKNDSIFEIGFVNPQKSSVSEMYIFEETRRIVGYLNMEKDTFIVLSHISSQFKFGMNMYKFIVPTGNKQRFDYIYFPDDLYGPADRGFPPPPLLFDPYYSWYTYQNGKYVYQEGFTTGKY